MSDKREFSIDDIKTVLSKSSKTKLGWYQKLDIIGHTGFVLIFDGVKKFTIDYGTRDGNFFNEKGEIEESGGVHIYEYKQIYRFKFVLCQIPKSRVIEFVQQCLAHKKDSYNLVTNNCRDFVAKIGKELFDEKLLENKKYLRLIACLKDIQTNDNIKLVLGEALLAIVLSMFGPSDSDDEEN